MFLTVNGVWNAVDGTIADRVAAGTANQEQLAKDAQAFAYIVLYTAYDLQHLVKDKTTAAMAWTTLKGHFETLAAPIRIFLERELATVSQKSGETAASYVARVQRLRDRIVFAGGVVTDSDFVSKVMVGVHERYLPAVLYARRHQDLSIAILLSYLSEMESQLNGGDRASNSDVQAHVVQRFRGKCNNCGLVGHKEIACRDACSVCGKRGHTQRKCFHTTRNNDSEQVQANVAHTELADVSAYALTAVSMATETVRVAKTVDPSGEVEAHRALDGKRVPCLGHNCGFCAFYKSVGHAQAY